MDLYTSKTTYDDSCHTWTITIHLKGETQTDAIRAALYFMNKIEQMPQDYGIEFPELEDAIDDAMHNAALRQERNQ